MRCDKVFMCVLCTIILSCFNVCNATSNSAKRDTMTLDAGNFSVHIVTGFIDDVGKSVHVVAKVSVYLITDATGEKTGILASGYTDDNGALDVAISSRGLAATGRSLRARVDLYNRFVSILNWDGASGNNGTIKAYDPAGSTPLLSTGVTILTVILPNNSSDRSTKILSLIYALSMRSARLGVTSMIKATVWYPGNSSRMPYTSAKKFMSIPTAYANDTIAIYREYGHWFMYSAAVAGVSRNILGSYIGVGQYDVCDTTRVPSETLAFVDGYADAFAAMMLSWPDNRKQPPLNFYINNSIESYSCTLPNMENDRGRIAAALWDLWDTADESNVTDTSMGQVGFGDMNSADPLSMKQILVDPLRGPDMITGIRDYWRGLASTLSDEQRESSMDSLRYNKASFGNVSVSGVIDTGSCSSSDCEYHVSWNATDTGACLLQHNVQSLVTTSQGSAMLGRYKTSERIVITVTCSGWSEDALVTLMHTNGIGCSYITNAYSDQDTYECRTATSVCIV